MVGIGLVAALVMGAVAAAPSMAAKSPYSVNTVSQYKYCPWESSETIFCFAGITSGGTKGGFFELGTVKVKLNKPITLQGGMRYNKTDPGGTWGLVAAANGGETLESPVLKAQGGLGVITKAIQEKEKWPTALKESFKEAKQNKENTVGVKIEVAGGNLIYEDEEALSSLNIILEKGIAFKLPLKVKLINPWLEKLGGGPCTIGSDALPVQQNLTTEGAGSAGELLFEEPEGVENLALVGSKLVDTGWEVPAGGGATGCGGEYEEYVNEALNDALHIGPGKKGITVLQGTLYVASLEEGTPLYEKLSKGEL